MSFFSFGKKDDAPSGRDAYSDSPRGSRQTVRTERRTRRSDRPEADAMMLDPTLPEKQRARRRLVGALALVAAAVIVLPMVLDSHPKPITDDISIDIPARPAAPLPKTSRSDTAAGPATDSAAESATDTQAGVAPDSPAADADNPPKAAAPAARPESKPAAKPAESQAQAKAAASAPAAQKPVTPATPPAQAAKPLADAPATAAAAQKNTPASPAGSRFVIQIGTFDDDAVAQSWVAKLKAAGVPAYVEHRKEADGTTRALLRAGPFADRTAASAALGKVRQAGLGGGGNNNASAN